MTDQPDVEQLSRQDLPQAPFPGGGRQPFRIFFDSAVHGGIWNHARDQRSVEICGVLVGKWGRDADGPFVSISDAIRGEAATNKFAEVTFTHETWARINQEMDTRFADRVIVGWYHSHPDFGVFLSDRDVFIQQHFFSGPGQLAHVVDPVRGTEGVFIWRKGKPVLAPFYWVGDRPLTGGPDPSTTAPGTDGLAAGGSGALARYPPRVSWLERILPWLAFLGLFVIGYMAGSIGLERERAQTRQDAVAEAAFLVGVKPGLREALDRIHKDLEDTGKELAILAKAGPPADEEQAKERQTQVRATYDALAGTRRQLRALQANYCLTEAETRRLVERTAVFLVLTLPGLSTQERARLVRRTEEYLLEDIKEGRLLRPPPETPNGPAKDETGQKAEPGKEEAAPKPPAGAPQ